MKIGVFDSGIGGEAMAQALKIAFPTADLVTVNDRGNVPYGSKSPDKVRELTERAIQSLIGQDVIVIACNTATTLALPYLRTKYPQQKFIGIEPMIKPASIQTKTGVICICATPATLASVRYNELKKLYAGDLRVIEPDCSQWATMIEQNTINEEIIRETISPALESGADVVVLGCTHYHWIKEIMKKVANGQAITLEPSEAIAKRVEKLVTEDIATKN